MFLHCHNCLWEQDDFWSETYNPIYCLSHLKELLFQNLDEIYIQRDGYRPALTYREYIIKELESALSKVAGMKWKIYAEHNNDPCPRCGSVLCID